MTEVEILEKYFFGYFAKYPIDSLGFYSGFIPLIFCVIYFKPTWRYSKVLIFYVFLILLLEFIGAYYSANKWNNHIFYLLFYLFESICLYIFYLQSIEDKAINRNNLILLIIIIISIIYNSIYSSNQINDYSISIQSLGFICISLNSFYYILSKAKIKNLTKSTFFWINTGALIYFSGILFVFLFITKLLNENTEIFDSLFDIYTYMLVIFRIFIAIGISKAKYQKSI